MRIIEHTPKRLVLVQDRWVLQVAGLLLVGIGLYMAGTVHATIYHNNASVYDLLLSAAEVAACLAGGILLFIRPYQWRWEFDRTTGSLVQLAPRPVPRRMLEPIVRRWPLDDVLTARVVKRRWDSECFAIRLEMRDGSWLDLIRFRSSDRRPKDILVHQIRIFLRMPPAWPGLLSNPDPRGVDC